MCLVPLPLYFSVDFDNVPKSFRLYQGFMARSLSACLFSPLHYRDKCIPLSLDIKYILYFSTKIYTVGMGEGGLV